MLHPFNWHHSLYYGEKWNLSDFDTKNPKSLNHLLKKMYMLGYKNGHFLMKNSLPAFNAAYYVAVAISNTEGIDETNLEEEINTSVRTIWEEDFCRYHKDSSHGNNFCPFAELILIKWMIYAILWLQENKSKEMESFLKWEYRYNTELTPHPLHPKYYTDFMWTNTVSKYDMNDMLWQLSFFPTPKEQHDFLDWAKKMSDKHKFDVSDDLPF